MNTHALRFAVMGAGAVGCYYGGMLARAGHAVTLIARPAHVAAIAEGGLRIETRAFDERVQLAATSDPAGVQDADVVLFCVKSPDTELAGAQLLAHLRPDTLVLCLQNGVDNAERLRTVLPSHTVAAAVVYVATEMPGPGHVKHHGRGELVIEPAAGSVQVAQAMSAAGLPSEVSDNVRGALWMKLIINCAYNAVSAIAQAPYGETVRGTGIPELMQAVVGECVAVARAEGVSLPGDVDAAVRRIAETMPGQMSSTAQDLARGKRSEIDHLNGLVVRRGAAHGIATPANQALWALVKLLEGRAPAPPQTQAP